MTKAILIVAALLVLGSTLPTLMANSRIQGYSNLANVLGKETEDSHSENDNEFLGQSLEKLQEAGTKVKNKEAKTEVEDAIEETQQAETEIEDSIATMEARPSIVKFIMGPDYKNAGQVRSEIVRLRNQIAKLTRTQEKLGATESATISESISTLQSELTAIETRLYENLQGISLLGWLGKLLTGFSPQATPIPTATP